MIDEKRLVDLAQRTEDGSDEVECTALGQRVALSRREIEDVAYDIDGQIVARDYKLIDQSEMIVAYFPTDASGEPLIAGGVQSEIEYASASTKKVVILWEASRDPTPFIGQRGDVLVRSHGGAGGAPEVDQPAAGPKRDATVTGLRRRVCPRAGTIVGSCSAIR